MNSALKEFDLMVMIAGVWRWGEKMEKRFVYRGEPGIPRGGALYVHRSQNSATAGLAPKQHLSRVLL
jgi:hypothetical protein